MRNRILAALAVLALALGVGGLAATHADAAPAPTAQTLSTTERGLCIKQGTGEPRSLWLVEATGLCPAPYWGPASLEDAFRIDVAALVKAEVTRQGKVATAKPAADEAAPTLAANGSPNITAIPLKWTAANPPGDDTVSGYEVRYRKTSVASWTTVPALGNVLSTSLVVPAPATQYLVQVRAQYNTTSGGYGPWSNTLTATTDATP